ncbi:hypothetical protein SAMN02949497_1913 [Methylomagnum ishizawai]|uniref:Uncharacterized protein n=2 Tax=Methylomagnum ishizawai TaxID=1760988 RepID=A0A1Y6D216_9GAMM|nr:hypothetical protein SAMN02949497_1913 [Methylomagnum ishizawai]
MRAEGSLKAPKRNRAHGKAHAGGRAKGRTCRYPVPLSPTTKERVLRVSARLGVEPHAFMADAIEEKVRAVLAEMEATQPPAPDGQPGAGRTGYGG